MVYLAYKSHNIEVTTLDESFVPGLTHSGSFSITMMPFLIRYYI